MMLGSFKKQIKTLVGLLVFLAFLLTPFSAAAQNSAGLTLAVQAGFNGYCRSREWMPVQITLDNTGPLVEGRLEILQSPVQTSPVVYAGDVSLPNPAHKVVTLFIYADGYLDSLSVRLVKNGGQVLANATAKLICLSPNDRLYGILSDRPDTFNILSQITRENVSELRPAWTYRSADGSANIQCNPIVVKGVIFTPTPGAIFAARFTISRRVRCSIAVHRAANILTNAPANCARAPTSSRAS